MARQEFSGSAVETVLASGISDSDTIFTIVDATGWPDGSVGNFVVTLDRGESTEEKVLCASRSGTIVTVAPGGRGYDGTTAHSHATGATAKHTISAAQMDVWDRHVADEDVTAHAAEKISFTPAGTVAAVNVQAAVEELDTDITDLRAKAAGFGDGSDGDVTIVGTVTLVRDMNYRTLTVPSGATLITKGFVIRASESVTVEAGGVIHDDGEDGADAVGFNGGNGGNSGGGGGGGYGRGALAGSRPAEGGGGGGGGVVVIVTPTFVNNGTVRANGGKGGNRGSSSAGTGANGSPGTGRIAGGILGLGGRPGPNAALDFCGGGYSDQVPPIMSPVWGYTVVGILPVGPARIFGGVGGDGDGGGGHGGVILTVTRSRSGAGTYQVVGGAVGLGGEGRVGTVGQIHHISIGA